MGHAYGSAPAIGVRSESATTERYPASANSYDILFDPKYKGKVGMPDDPLGAYGQAARVLGLNSSRMSKEDFAKVTNWLKDLAKQTKGISASYGDVSTRFIAGDIALSFLGWAAYKSFAEKAGKKTIETVWPKTVGVLPSRMPMPYRRGADNIETAYAFINETLRPEIQAEMAKALVGGVVVSGARSLIRPLPISIPTTSLMSSLNSLRCKRIRRSSRTSM